MTTVIVIHQTAYWCNKKDEKEGESRWSIVGFQADVSMRLCYSRSLVPRWGVLECAARTPYFLKFILIHYARFNATYRY